jgi:hypothetical protein
MPMREANGACVCVLLPAEQPRGDGPEYAAVDAVPRGLPPRRRHGLETETVRRCGNTTLLPTA